MKRFRSAFLLLMIITYHSDGHSGREDQALFFIPSLIASLYVPVSAGSADWHYFTTTGMGITIPSTLRGVLCRMELCGGVITDQKKRWEIPCIHFKCGIVLPDVACYRSITVAPALGVSNLTIRTFSGGLGDRGHRYVFTIVENEFGVYTGIEPLLTWKKFTFSLPVSAERIFSSPKRFTTIAFSINAGYRFGE